MCLQVVEGVSETGTRRFGRVAETPVALLEVITEFEERLAFHRLVGESTVAEKGLGRAFLDAPEADTMGGVVVGVPLDPPQSRQVASASL